MIFQNITAIWVLHNHGIAEALRLYPDQSRFIERNKDRDQWEVIEELEDKLQPKSKYFRTDVPYYFTIVSMEECANPKYYMANQAKAVLDKAKAEADRRGIPYHRLRFYIDCWGYGYQYYIVNRRKQNE